MAVWLAGLSGWLANSWLTGWLAECLTGWLPAWLAGPSVWKAEGWEGGVGDLSKTYEILVFIGPYSDFFGFYLFLLVLLRFSCVFCVNRCISLGFP